VRAFNGRMKTVSLAALLVLGLALAGCAVVPLEPYGPAAVVVQPAPHYHPYYGRDYYGPRSRRWR
jgi:hypothetical protein